MHISKEVSFMTTSFPAIHFFYNSAIISREHLKKSTCQGNCAYFTTLFATIHYNISGLWLIREKVEEYVYFRKTIVTLLLPIHSTELVAISFSKKYCVKCTKALTEIPFFHGEPA